MFDRKNYDNETFKIRVFVTYVEFADGTVYRVFEYLP